MAPLAKRPRSSEDHDSATVGYYDNVPGTSMTRPSIGPTSAISAPGHPPYLAPYAPVVNGSTSPLLSHLSARSLAPGSTSHHHSSGQEDNAEDMVPPKSSSTQSTRARGRGRGRSRGRGRPRSSTTRPVVDDEGVSQHNGHPQSTANGHRDFKTDEEADADTPLNPLIFQCRKCFRLLGDSFSFVATDTELGYVILSDVSEVVTQGTAFSTSTEPGKDIGSTFASLRCAGCRSVIGRNYRTTPRDLDDLRDCFSLQVDAIFTYQLGSNYTKQLETDQWVGDGQDNGLSQRESRQSASVTLDAGLETKMERTRAFTIELSDRLIKAEEDIRRYGALVQKLLRKEYSHTRRLQTSNAGGSAPAVPEPSSEALFATETANTTNHTAAEQTAQKEAASTFPADGPTIPTGEPLHSVKQESHRKTGQASQTRSPRSSATTT